jgi:hypothetical protein
LLDIQLNEDPIAGCVRHDLQRQVIGIQARGLRRGSLRSIAVLTRALTLFFGGAMSAESERSE